MQSSPFRNTAPALRAAVIATAFTLGAAWPGTVHAQSSDAILDLLVKKGIVSESELKDLRKASDENFAKRFQAKSGQPEWVTSLKLSGDFRGRYEGLYSDNPLFVDRDRFRYRVRFGAVATLKDNFEVGLRLTSAEPVSGGGAGGDPISSNTSFQDNGAKKFVYLDLAYAKWTQVKNDTWTGAFTVGKMENPFVVSDLVFDHDYTPEGVAEQLVFNANAKQALKLNLGGFALDELKASSDDPYLLGVQLRLDSQWSPRWQTTVGVGGFGISGKDALVNGNVPNQNLGNTRTGTNTFGGGALTYNYNPVVVDAAATYSLAHFPGYDGSFPIKLAADYMNNLAVSTRNQAYSVGLTFGKAGKKGQWDVSYRWKHLGGDAWFEELVDSDFGAFYETAADKGGAAGYGAGTNVRGHVVRVNYSPANSLILGVTYTLAELIKKSPATSDSEMGRLQVDATWKF